MVTSNDVDRAQWHIYALLESMHWWASGRIVPYHGTDPSSIPGQCNQQNTLWMLHSQAIAGENFQHYKCKQCLDYQQRITFTFVVV